MSRACPPRLLAALSVLLWFGASAPAQSTATWGGGSASWNAASNWSGGTPPGLTDSALVTRGAASVDTDVSVAKLLLSGGTLTGAANLTLTGGGSAWNGGDLNGSGTFTIASGGSLSISADGSGHAVNHDYSGRPIVNNGTIDWNAGAGDLRSGNGGSLTIGAMGVFNDYAGGTISSGLGGTATFTNNGSFHKLSSGTTTISQVFENNQSVLVSAGNLLLAGGGSAGGSATYYVDPGANLTFGGGTHTLAGGASLSGSGNINLTAGAISVPSGTASFENLSFSAGTLSGAGAAAIGGLVHTGGAVSIADLTLTGVSSWTGGNWNTTTASIATIASDATLTASGAGVKDFNRRTITNNGTIDWQGGQLRTGNGGGIINNGTVNDSADSFFTPSLGGTASFANAGTYHKNGTGTSTFQSAFNNTGTVNLNLGTLAFDNGGSTAAGSALNALAGTTLRFGGGTFTLGNGSTISSAGATTLTGGTLSLAAGTLSLPSLSVTGGTLDGAGTVSAAAFSQAGGTLELANLSLTNAATWTAGSWNSPSATAAAIAHGATLTLASTNVHDFNRRVITNDGTLEWQAGQFRSGNGGGLVNNAGATINDTASSFFTPAYGGSMTFTNAGTYNKNAAGTTNLQSVFNNTTGIVNINAGTLSLDGGGSTAAGSTINVGDATTLRFGGGNFTIANASQLAFAGGSLAVVNGNVSLSVGGIMPPSVALSGGTLSLVDAAGNSSTTALAVTGGTLAGAGSFATTALTQSGGSIANRAFVLNGNGTWSAGDWSSSTASTATIASGVTLSLTTTNVHDFNRRVITNHGTLDWQAGQFRSGNGGSFVNAGDGAVTDAANSFFNAAFGGTASFVNHGTYDKNGTGTSNFQSAFDNDGHANVNSGTLSLTGGGSATTSAVFAVSPGATLNFGGGTYTLANGASLIGSGAVTLTNGTLAVSSGNVTLPNLSVSGGTLDGPGLASIAALTQTGGTIAINQLALIGSISWANGNWNATAGATATIAAGSTLDISDAATNVRDYNFRTITNQGTVNWNSAYLRSGNGGGFVNAVGAHFNDFNASNYIVQTAYGGTSSFTNHGIYTRNATGTTYFDAVFNNDGALNLQKGDIQIRGGGTIGATSVIDLASSTHLYFTNDYSLLDGARFTGAGLIAQTGGTLAIEGTLDAPSFTWSGGTWNAAANSGLVTTIGKNTTLVLTDDNGNLRDFRGRGVINNGTVNWQSGFIRSGQGGSFTNAAGATFNDFNASGYRMNADYGGSFVFTNNGTYNRNGAGTTYFDTTFDNNGTINVQQGDLQFRAGGTLASGGRIDASQDTNVYFTNDYTIANAASLLGAGTFWLTGGTLTANGTMNVSSFHQIGGTLGGAGTINGTFTWSGGNWNAPVVANGTPPSTTIGKEATLDLTDENGNLRDYNFRAIVNLGTVNWSSGYLRSGQGGSFTNEVGGVFNDLNSSSYRINADYGNGATFVNKGTYNRDTTGTTYFDTTFNNEGTLNLKRGDIQIRAGGTMGATSVVDVATGAHLYITADYALLDGAQFTGAGLIAQIGGTLTTNGAIRASTFTWSGGNWNTAANSGLTTTIASGSTLLLTDANNNLRDFSGRGIVNDGVVDWQSGFIRSGQGGSFTNAAGGTFNDQNVSSYRINRDYGGAFVFTNNGTYDRNVGGTTYFDTTFDNNGTLTLRQGDIQLRAGGTMGANSRVTVSDGAHLYITDDYTLIDGAQLNGAGLIAQIGGTLTANGAIRASAFTWSGGDWNAASNSGLTTTIASGSTLLLTDANNNLRDFSGRGIVNEGVVNWQSGYLRSGQGGSFTNAAGATFNDQNVSSYRIDRDYSGAFVFTNNGTYDRNVGGTTYFDTTFDNNGTLTLRQGDIQLRAGGTMGAKSRVAVSDGAHLYITDDYSLLEGAQFSGTGLIAQIGGTLTANGAIRASTFTWSGGDWNAANNSGLTTTIAAGTILNLTDANNNIRDFNGRGIVNEGVVNWSSGYLRSGQGGSFTNVAGATFNDLNAPGYTVQNVFGGTFTFTNAGTYVKATTGTTQIQVPFTNSGTILAQAGTLHFTSTFTNNNGAITLSGGTVSFAGTLNLGTGQLGGTGTISASSVIAGGFVSPGNSPGALTLTGNLTLLDTSKLIIELGGTTQGADYDFLNVGGSAGLTGTLDLRLINGFMPELGNRFTILTAKGGILAGTFLNAANNSRLFTSDGLGSFLVSYDSNNVVLSQFQAVPEPSTWVLLGLGALGVLGSCLRRKR